MLPMRDEAIACGSVFAGSRATAGCVINRKPESLVVGIVFIIALCVMVAIPTVRLLDSTQGRFGWHMFSRGAALPQLVLEFDDGSSEEVHLEDHLAVVRSDAPIATALPPELCRRVDRVRVVLVQQGGESWTVPCR